MKGGDRYDTADLEEDQREPGSRGRVLKNLPGIKSKREMDRVEAREQVRALQKLITLYGPAHRFTAADVCRIHNLWLDPIYSWAGQYRPGAALMGLQAGLPSLFFGDIKGRKRQEYFTAVRAGLEQNYEPMQRIFSDVIGRTLQIHGET